MKKLYILISMLSIGFSSFSQVGINTTTPNAQLEIKSSNQATPANTDGILIPKIDAFPITNPTAAQDGMMVYLTTTVGLNIKGFYSWDSATNSWKSVSGISSENDPQVSSATSNTIPKYNGTTLVDGIITDNGTNVGIGTNNPQSKLEVVTSGTAELKISSTSGFGASRLSMISDKGTVNEWRPGYIESGDNNTGSFAGRLDFYTNGVGPLFGSIRAMSLFNGNTGIGIVPTSGNKLEVAGKTKTDNLQMTTGATANYIMQSDATGNATWVNPSSLPVVETDPQVSSATNNAVPKYNGSTLVDGVMIDNGTNVGIGTTPTAGNKLEVAGKTLTSILEVTNKTTTDRFRMINGATDKYILQSDTNGNAIWEKNNGGFTHYLGELYLGGIIFELHKEADGLEHGYIVATTQGSGEWQTTNSVTGANREEDGQYNSNLMVNSPLSIYLATLPGIGWYLPSKYEFLLLYNNAYIFQKVLRANSLPIIQFGYYHWTSTELGIDNALQWKGTFFDINPKWVGGLYRAIKRF